MFEPHQQPTSVVRPRSEDDLPACAAVLVAVYEADGYPVEGVAEPEAWLTPTGLLQAWVAELAGEVIGHVCLTEPTDTDAAATVFRRTPEGSAADIAVLGRLFVHPEARGHRAGELLTRTAMNHATTHGLRLVLDAMEKDQAAIRLYERLGWHRIGTTDHDSGHGLVSAYCYVSPTP